MRFFAVLALLISSVSVFAADAPAAGTAYTLGKDYQLLADPVRPQDTTKIEVAEVFSFACPHCFHFEPLLQAWAKRQAPDVNLVQTHASFNPAWVVYQRGFYTLHILKPKDKEKVQAAVFNTVHVARKELSDAKAWADFLVPFGIDKDTALKTFDSFGVTSQMKQADARVRGLMITSTPQIVVDGKYRVTANSHEDMLKVADYLVEKVRAERAAAKH